MVGGAEAAALECILNAAHRSRVLCQEHAFPLFFKSTGLRGDVGPCESGDDRLVDCQEEQNDKCRRRSWVSSPSATLAARVATSRAGRFQSHASDSREGRRDAAKSIRDRDIKVLDIVRSIAGVN